MLSKTVFNKFSSSVKRFRFRLQFGFVAIEPFLSHSKPGYKSEEELVSNRPNLFSLTNNMSLDLR